MLKFSGFSRLISGRNVSSTTTASRALPFIERASLNSNAEFTSRFRAQPSRVPSDVKATKRLAAKRIGRPSVRLAVVSAATPNARDNRTPRDVLVTDPETGVASGLPEAAICVQDFDVQCVLQFTLINAAGCALHRHTSRVIHRLEWSLVLFSRESGRHSHRADAADPLPPLHRVNVASHVLIGPGGRSP
jgi:hypothetical protein